MNNETPGSGPSGLPGSSGTARAARAVARRVSKAALATTDVDTGAPYASLVTVATLADARPVLLLSRLARHTRNLEASNRVSLLLDASGERGDPLEGARVTLIGTIVGDETPLARARFLARHPEAEGYAGFADFSFYRIDVDQAHFIGGFGRIETIGGDDFLIEEARSDAFAQAEPGIVGHMNEDHDDAVALYATALLGEAHGPWRMTGLDAEGCDLALDGRTVRLDFEQPLDSPAGARHCLVALVKKARGEEGNAA